MGAEILDRILLGFRVVRAAESPVRSAGDLLQRAQADGVIILRASGRVGLSRRVGMGIPRPPNTQSSSKAVFRGCM